MIKFYTIILGLLLCQQAFAQEPFIAVRNGATRICKGDSAEITVIGCPQTAKWSNGQRGLTIFVKESAIYFAVCTDPDGNETSTSSNPINLTKIESIPIQLNSPTVVCPGETFSANAVPGDEALLVDWYGPEGFTQPGSQLTVSDFNDAKSGYYRVKAYYQYGCWQEDSILVSTASQAPAPTLAVKAADSCRTALLLDATPQLAGEAYQWYINEVYQPTQKSSQLRIPIDPSLRGVIGTYRTQLGTNGCEGGNSPTYYLVATESGYSLVSNVTGYDLTAGATAVSQQVYACVDSLLSTTTTTGALLLEATAQKAYEFRADAVRCELINFISRQLTAPRITTDTNVVCNAVATLTASPSLTAQSGGVVEWYSTAGGGPIGTGNSLRVTPTQATTYFARFNYANCLSESSNSITITVLDSCQNGCIEGGIASEQFTVMSPDSGYFNPVDSIYYAQALAERVYTGVQDATGCLTQLRIIPGSYVQPISRRLRLVWLSPDFATQSGRPATYIQDARYGGPNQPGIPGENYPYFGSFDSTSNGSDLQLLSYRTQRIYLYKPYPQFGSSAQNIAPPQCLEVSLSTTPAFDSGYVLTENAGGSSFSQPVFFRPDTVAAERKFMVVREKACAICQPVVSLTANSVLTRKASGGPAFVDLDIPADRYSATGGAGPFEFGTVNADGSLQIESRSRYFSNRYGWPLSPTVTTTYYVRFASQWWCKPVQETRFTITVE